jgi:hypothetical protein
MTEWHTCIHPLEITYTVAPDRASITFHPCGVTSSNPHDIDKLYCPACHRFMELIELARRWSKLGKEE